MNRISKINKYAICAFIICLYSITKIFAALTPEVQFNIDLLQRDPKALEYIKNASNINFKFTSGSTPLIYSIQYNNMPAYKALMEKNADINIKGNQQTTALIEAVKKQNAEIVQELLKRGANIYDKNSEGQTALDIADKQKDKNIASLLTHALALQKAYTDQEKLFKQQKNATFSDIDIIR